MLKNKTLRRIVTQIARDFGEEKNYPIEDWLYIGIIDFIPEKKLLYLAEQFTTSTQVNWTHKWAKYFLDKKEEEEKP